MESRISEEIYAETAGCEDASRLRGFYLFRLERKYVLDGAFRQHIFPLLNLLLGRYF